MHGADCDSDGFKDISLLDLATLMIQGPCVAKWLCHPCHAKEHLE